MQDRLGYQGPRLLELPTECRSATAAFCEDADRMTIHGEPIMITSTTPHPAERPNTPASYPRTRSTLVRLVTLLGSSRPNAPAAAPLPRDPGDPPAEAANRAQPGRSVPKLEDTQDAAGTQPLRARDPVVLAGYRLVSRLGTGGMADVFYAVSPTGRPVAVKLLRAADGAPQACQREYQLASTVDPNYTAPPLGHGTSRAGPYLVTAYLPGYRSGSTLLGRPKPIEQLWTFGSALAQVLAAVHARGVVHCDVKPSNLLVRGRDVRLIDFGISRYLDERCEPEGTVQCTRGWAAPEQLDDAPATPAVDIFAWGCILAHMASGVHPFASRDVAEWILRLQSAKPDLPTLPADLDKVIRQTLARDPRDRPSAHALARTCEHAR